MTMHERDDYAEQGAPVVLTQQSTRAGVLASIARAIVSLTLLGVLLLAFGAALGSWFLNQSLQSQLRDEIRRTSFQQQLMVAYRDELISRHQRMAIERNVATPPTLEDLYPSVVLARRGADDALPQNYDWQAPIDTLREDNNDLRWANASISQGIANRRNPSLPRENRGP